MAVIRDITFDWPPPPQFWTDSFPKATDAATAPALFKALMPNAEAGARAVADAFTYVQRHPRGPWRLRLYIGEERRDDLVERLRNEPLDGLEDFDDFARRAVEAERYCIVVNNLEVASPRLAWALGELLHSMHENRGAPLGGAEQVAFIGNYSGTPFGVHEGYEDAFLIHLGPGTKRFYCWTKEQYSLLTGGRAPTFGDYSRLLEHATEFVLEPGDVFFLPAEVYHVGMQSELSISIAVPLYTYPLERFFLRAVLPSLAEEVLSEVDGNPSELLPSDPHSAVLRSRMEHVGRLLLERLAQRLPALLPELLDDHWWKVCSNGGWEAVAANEDDADLEPLAANEQLVLRPPTRLVHDSDVGQTLRIYARGHRIAAVATPAILALLETLQRGEPVRFDQANEDSAQLLSELDRAGALVRPSALRAMVAQ